MVVLVEKADGLHWRVVNEPVEHQQGRVGIGRIGQQRWKGACEARRDTVGNLREAAFGTCRITKDNLRANGLAARGRRRKIFSPSVWQDRANVARCWA